MSLPSVLLSNRFSQLTPIAQGATAVLFVAQDAVLQRLVAIKRWKDDGLESEQKATREANVLKHFNHPNVVRLLDAVDSDNGRCLVLQHFKSGDLEKLLEKNQVPYSEKLKLLRSICSGLQHVHDQGWVHGDVKPANLVVGENGRIAWCDFGSAVRIADSQPEILGSIGYLAPEVASQESAASVQSDIYALGITLYEILEETKAFPDASLAAHSGAEPVRLPNLQSSDLPRRDAWQAILNKATHLKPELRYRTVAELFQDIRLLDENLPISAKRDSWIRKFAMWCNRERLLASMAGFVVFSLQLSVLVSAWSWRHVESNRQTAVQQQKALDLEIAKSKGLQEEIQALAESAKVKGEQAAAEEDAAIQDAAKLLEVQDSIQRGTLEATALLEETASLISRRNELFADFYKERESAIRKRDGTVRRLDVETFDIFGIKEKNGVSNIKQETIYFNAINANKIRHAGARLSYAKEALEFSIWPKVRAFRLGSSEDLPSIGLEARTSSVRLAELGSEWVGKSLESMAETERNALPNRLRFGTIYEARRYRFRIVGMDDWRVVPIDEGLRDELRKLSFDPEHLSLLVKPNQEIAAELYDTKVSWEVMQLIHSAADHIHYEQVQFSGATGTVGKPAKVRTLQFTLCQFPPIEGNPSNNTFTLGNHPQLRRLRFDACTSVPPNAYIDPNGTPNLEEVSFYNNAVSQETAQAIAGLSSLRELELTETGSDLSIIQEIANSKSLERLILGKQPNLNADIFRPLSKMPFLLELTIHDLPLNEGDVRSLSLLTNLASFTVSDSTGKVGDYNLQGLEGLTQICCLDLRGNAFTDKTLETLSKCHRLRILTIPTTDDPTTTKMTQEGIDALKQTLPSLRIERVKF